MTRDDEPPAPLADLLDALAGRLRHVDIRRIDEARRLWSQVVDPVLAEHCRVELIKDHVLVVRVPSGAFAHRVTLDTPTILAGFSSLGPDAPTALRTVIE